MSRIRKKKLSSDSESECSTSRPQTKKSKRNYEYEPDEEQASTSKSSRKRPSDTTISSYRNSIENPSNGLQPLSIFTRCGKVISIRLKNFMCHSHLYIEFGPNINFIVGNNGSGKSAVITAISLGLASSARATSRASSAQKLIKNGETSSTIEITFSNSGLRPYKYDIYGPHITIVRHIRQTSSTYEVKDAHKKSVSKKLEDIRRILLFFGINVENPIFVLNQEASREFLKDLQPSSNYKLLMRATQMDTCASSLTQCHEQREHFSCNLEAMKKNRATYYRQCQTEEEHLATLENKEAIKMKLRKNKTILAWLQVTKIQNDVNNVEHTLKIIEKKIADLSQKTIHKNSIQDDLTKQLEKIDAEKQLVIKNFAEQDMKLRNVKRQILECVSKTSYIQANIKNLDKRLKEEKTNFDGCNKHMQNYQSDYSEIKKLKEQNVAKLAQFKAKVAESRELIKRLRADQNDVKENLATSNERADSARIERNKLQKSDQNLQYEIESLLRNKSNKMSVYGENAMQVANMLKAKYSGSNEQNMPRGPLGMYITVPNPKYRDLIENQLAHCLRSYIVNTDKDRLLLRGLLHKVFPGGNVPTIVTSSFTSRVYNVAKYKVQARSAHTTVLMDEIRCDDPVVMNYLIDTMRIETVLITDSKDTAESLTSHSENVPPNLTRILVPNLRLEYCPSPNYAVYSIQIAQARFIQVNVDDRIRQLKTDQNTVQERLAMIKLQYEQAKENLDKENRNISAKRDLINKHHTENERLMQHIMDLENCEYRELPALDVIESHMTSSRENIEKLKQEREQLEDQLCDISKKKIHVEAENASEEKLANELKNKCSDIETSYNDVKSKLRDIDRYYEENKRRLKQTNELMATTLKNKQELEKDLEEARKKAEEIGDFIDTNKTEEQIRDKISVYTGKIKHFDSLNLNKKDIELKLTTLRLNYKNTSEKLENFLSLVEKLRISYHTRAQRFQRTRYHLFTMVQFQFKQALLCRQFEGDLEANHKEKTLEINVFPPSGNKTSNTRSLSGGERSFTTVSLLKGLWSTSDHPFYFLDEYDVFTDEVNRTFITKLLIQEGMDFQNRQYCFLTPQDTKVDANPLLKVHKLEAPEN